MLALLALSVDNDNISITSKCNSTARFVRVEENLQRRSAACAIFYSKCITTKCLTLKFKVTECNFRSGSIPWQIPTSTKVFSQLARAILRRGLVWVSRQICQGPIAVAVQLVIQMKIKEICLTLKMKVKLMIRNGVVQWQASICKNTLHICVRAFTISKILAFTFFT